MLRNMSVNADYFAPLARAVASMDRDAYAARFAVYDREHKALLRRLATAEEPCSDDDVAREEQAFRDAIRRIEFADEAEVDDQPTLVPQDEPDEEAPPVPPPRRAPWTELRPSDLRPSDLLSPDLRAPDLRSPDLRPREARPPDVRPADVRPPEVRPPDLRPLEARAPEPETFDVASLPGIDGLEPEIAVEPHVQLTDLQLSEPRSLARRVGERLVLAVLFLAAAGAFVWMVDANPEATHATGVSSAVEPAAAPAATNDMSEAKTQPNWLTPEIFYVPPSLASSAPASGAGPALASAPRDIPLPVPRPER
jgi:hypothetical protein